MQLGRRRSPHQQHVMPGDGGVVDVVFRTERVRTAL
jgi:hypothetical protein